MIIPKTVLGFAKSGFLESKDDNYYSNDMTVIIIKLKYF